MQELRIEVSPDTLRNLLGKSSTFDRRQKTNLRKRIREAAEPTRAAVASVARAGGPSRTGLREAIASGTRVQILAGNRAGVSIVTRAKLAQAWEGRRGWRHPVYGNRDTWAAQTGNPGYFSATVFARRNVIRAAVEKAMSDTLREMGGSS
jgi:hypothetical protein